jgi:ATP-dependent DNA ligase
MKRYPAYLYLFDLLYVDDYDVTTLPLKERKDLGKQLEERKVAWRPEVCYGHRAQDSARYALETD